MLIILQMDCGVLGAKLLAANRGGWLSGVTN